MALTGGAPWSTLGQSYGGFRTLTYLSLAPAGLRECFITGGLAGLFARTRDVYRRTYPRVVAKNDAYDARYPSDEEASAGSSTTSCVGSKRGSGCG